MEKDKMQKRYYWLKLSDDFFQDPVIKKLRKIAGGDTFTCIYLKMMLMSLKSSGVLIYEGIDETFEKELALKMDEDETNIKIVLTFLFSHHLITEESKKNRSYLMTAVPKMTGKEGESAERMRRLRAKTSQSDEQVTMSDAHVAKLPYLEIREGKTPIMSQSDEQVTASDVSVTVSDDNVRHCNAFKEISEFQQSTDKIVLPQYKVSQSDEQVTASDDLVTTENKRTEIDICSSSSFKDTTTTTYINSDLQKWLSHKSQGKNNPQGYEYTLLKKINDNEESVIREYHAWLENKATQVKSNELSSFKGKVLPTQDGDKVILGIELFEEKYRIYFEEGGFAIVQTLVNLPISERN